jgi:hypothetical protein
MGWELRMISSRIFMQNFAGGLGTSLLVTPMPPNLEESSADTGNPLFFFYYQEACASVFA